MNKEVISNHQGIAIVALFLMGSTLILATGVEAGRDLWIAVLVSIGLSIPIYAIYARLLSLFPNRDFFDILQVVLGKVLGKLVSVLYICFAFLLGTLVMRNFFEYLQFVGLPETPPIIPTVMFAFLCLLGVKEGIEVLGRWSTVFLNTATGFIVITVLLLINRWDLDNITPILYDGWGPVLRGATDVLAFPMAEIVVFLMIFAKAGKRNSAYKIMWGGLLVGGFFVFYTSLNEILTLGIELYSGTYFPSHFAVSLLRVGNFLERLEIIPAVAFFTGGFVKISVCMLAASRGVAKVFNFKDYRFIVTPIVLLMLNLTYFIYEDIVEMTSFSAEYWKLFALPYQLVLPILIWIVAEVKVRLGEP